MGDSTPRIEQRDTSAGAGVVATGDWTSVSLTVPQAWHSVGQGLRGSQVESPWDISGITRLDHIGAQLLWNHWGRRWPEQLEAGPAQRAVLAHVAEFSVIAPPEPTRTVGTYLLSMGGRLFALREHLRDLVRLIGQLFIDLGRLIAAPHQGPWRDVSGHLFHIGATAMPITALVGFLIGVVLAYLTSQQLRQFGADAFIVNILGLSLIRELGPVLAAVLIAGRSGSAITAQIGVMRVTEELDAMRVMGIQHGFRLVMPRAMALAVAMPLITVWTTLAALLG
ncbi:MAG: ABC transporter permease, partial [Lysobacteraceae bacterium]